MFENPTLILSVGGGMALILLIVGIVISIRSDQASVEERMGRYLDPAEQERLEAVKRTPLTDWLNKRVEKSSYGNSIAQSLARADLKIKPGEYIALMLIAAFGVGVVLWFIGGRSLITGAVGALLGLLLPGIYVKRQQGKRLIRFNEQLADMLNLMVNGLRAGFSNIDRKSVG